METLFPKASPEEYKIISKYLLNTISKENNKVPIKVSDISVLLPYKKGYGSKRFVNKKLHLGQRKLFLNKLQFLTDSLRSYRDRAFVIYAGAAPSVPIKILSDMFPEVSFLLVDPNPYHTSGVTPINLSTKSNVLKESVEQFFKNKDRIYIYNDLFTDELAQEIGSKSKEFNYDILFISDIRTSYGKSSGPTDLDIVWNNAQQTIWLHYMNPRRSMLKFRYPWWNDDEIGLQSITKRYMQGPYETTFATARKIGWDFISLYEEKKFPVWKGIFNIQPWAPLGTTETRLIVDKNEMEIHGTKNIDDYEGRLFYLNLLSRGITHYKNNNTTSKICFDNCYDCALENEIWETYRNKFNSTLKVRNSVLNLCRILHHSLCREEHGTLTKCLTIKNILSNHDRAKVLP